MSNLEKVLKKYWDVIPYLFFGVCTTIANIASYWICAHILHIDTMISTVTAWFVAVFLAYITNRRWVFKSAANSLEEIVREVVSFFACRIATGVVDWGCMYVFVEIAGWDDVVIKTLANILVVVLNYLASKMIIFKK